MKQIVRTLTACALLTLLMTSCENRASKKESTKTGAGQAETAAENKAAKEKTLTEWNLFKYVSDTTLLRIEKRMSELETEMAKRNMKNEEILQKQLAEDREELKALQERLKARNKEIEQEVKKFDQSVYKRSEAFQREFDHDMKELNTAILDLFRDNVN